MSMPTPLSLEELILLQLRSVIIDSPQFTAGILNDSLSAQDQQHLAERLNDLAHAIQERANKISTNGSVVDAHVRENTKDADSSYTGSNDATSKALPC